MKLSRAAKILIASGATLITGAFFFGKKAKANALNEYTLPANDSRPGASVVVTEHDKVYDYKYDNGIWYTRKKGATDWINMQTALIPENYQSAVSKLKKYIQPQKP